MIKCVLGELTPTLARLFAKPGNLREHAIQILKDDDSSFVCVVEADGRALVVKHSHSKKRWRAIRWAFQSSRAVRQFLNAVKLRQYAIPTAKPVAALETRFGPFRGSSFYISEYLPGLQAGEFFSQEMYRALWPTVARKLVKILDKLYAARLSHHDLNLSNLIIDEDEPKLIDLDSMRYHRFDWALEIGAYKDRTRLMSNWRLSKLAPADAAELERLCAALWKPQQNWGTIRVTGFQKG